MLLFAAHNGGRMAVPLSMVHRLEEFPRSVIERIGTREVVQYRGEILPLIQVSRVLRQRSRLKQIDRGAAHPQGPNGPARDKGGPIQVVVCEYPGRRAGLVVDRILDIAEEIIVSRAQAHRPGVLFTAVIQGFVTEFLDVESIIRAADPSGLETQPAAATKA
jgi:two-component system, chemotaxis family, sensor kinase CheA